MQYNYDENGVTFYWFITTVLLILIIPLTLIPLFSFTKAVATGDVRRTKKITIVKKTTSSISLKTILVIIGWVLVSFLSYKIATTETQEVKRWDPFEILEIAEGLEEKEIKKRYRKLSLKFHPDKIRTDDEKEREELNTKYVEITKAYKALTDPEIKRNYEEYGHPDGRQPFQLGIALPLWLVESHNNFYVLSFYGVILGLFLPYYVGKWWYRALKYTRDRILNNTMALYFKELKENTFMKDLILMMSSSYEFEEEIELKWDQEPIVAELWKDMVEVAQKEASIIDLPKVHNLPYVKKAFALIQSHLYRVQVKDAQLLSDQQEILRRLLTLINGTLQITIAQGWLEPTIRAIEFSQIIVQGLRHKASPLLQLPFVDRQLVRYIKTHNKDIRNVLDLMKIPEAQRRKLLTDLSDSQYQELIAVGNKFPVLKAIDTDVRVLGEDIITPGSIITLVVKLNLKTIEQALKDSLQAKSNEESDPKSQHRSGSTSESLDEVEDLGKLLAKLDDGKDSDSGNPLTKASKLSQVPHAYSPYFPGVKQLQWWVVVGDRRNNRMLIPPTKISELIDETSVKFQFGGPENPGSYSFEIFIKSDSYLGVDIKEEFNFEVKPADALPEESDYEDDISEPGDDSFAAQMNQAKSGGGAGLTSDGKRVYKDDETSDDDDGDDENDNDEE